MNNTTTKPNETFVGKVKITYNVEKKSFDFAMPSDMSGKQYKQWQNRKKDAIDAACESLITASKPPEQLIIA